MSFNHLEKDIIRPKFGEPRVHCALNCASRSCPPLNQEPFRADKLDAQLEKLAVAFVNSPKGRLFRGEKHRRTFRDFPIGVKDDFRRSVARWLSSTSDASLPCLTTLRSFTRITTGR